jgi:hypothetical protein
MPFPTTLIIAPLSFPTEGPAYPFPIGENFSVTGLKGGKPGRVGRLKFSKGGLRGKGV